MSTNSTAVSTALASGVARRPWLATNRLPLIAAIGLAATLSTTATTARAQTYTFSTIASFDGTNGANPYAGVTLDSSGNLYGTTYQGGANNVGTVYKIAAGTNALSTVVSFDRATTGASPRGGVTLDSNGNLYGTTEGGSTSGASDTGTAFEIAAGTSTITTLATFTGADNGAYPYTGLTLDSLGNLYGTTYNGGTNGVGTVYEIAAGTNTFTTLASFTGGNEGTLPQAGLTIDSLGNLYGTTANGGTSDAGTVFEIAAGSGTITTLVTFTGTGNGANPQAGLALDANGNLFGTTAGGTNGSGTVFTLATSAPEPSALLLLVPGALGMVSVIARRRRDGCTAV